MSKSAENPEQHQQQQQQQVYTLSRNSTNSSSASSIKLDELSPFGATKQNRLPALIKLNQVDDYKQQENGRKTVSMPIYNGSEIEQEPEKGLGKREASLPAEMKISSSNEIDERQSKNLEGMERIFEGSSELQINGLPSGDLIGPSLPAPLTARELASAIDWSANAPTNQFDDDEQQPQDDDLVGDSLIEMIINLRNENQDLIHALETNNEYIKQRLDDFKRVNEELKQQDAKFAFERSDYEQKLRKLQHENTVLSDKLKTMEAKLTGAKCNVKDSLNMADSWMRPSEVDLDDDKMYPDLSERESNNLDVHQMMTLEASSKLTGGDDASTVSSRRESGKIAVSDAQKVGEMSTEDLSKRFDAIKTDFYASDDRMEQCDKLEKQLNDIGTRDYEICLLQQQLNIFRQDFRLERMANLEAKLQIERLKNDIDKLCLERLKDNSRMYGVKGKEEEGEGEGAEEDTRNKPTYRPGSHVRFGPGAAAEAMVSRLGHQLSKKAARSAAKAAKYASKQAYREERAAAAAAVAAAAAANPDNDANSGHHGHRRHHSQHYHRGHHRGIKSEVVSDLLSTANKAMLTGYKMASNHVNMALDRLNQPAANEQATTTSSNQTSGRTDATGKRAEPSAPPMSLD